MTIDETNKPVPPGSASEGLDAQAPIRRPRALADIVGQSVAITKLREFAALYRKSNVPPGHILITGPAGVGKRTLARAFGAEFCARVFEHDRSSLTRTGDLMGALTNLGGGDALLIRDIGKIPNAVADFLFPALKDWTVDFVVDKGMFAKTIRVPLKRFTCLATSGSKSGCPPGLADAFALTVSLQPYSRDELTDICILLANQRRLVTTRAAAAAIAAVSDGTPRGVDVVVDRLGGLGRTSISELDLKELAPILGPNLGAAVSDADHYLEELSGADFEKLTARLFHSLGFHVEMTKASGDGGMDIVATLNRPLIGGRYLVQCKKYAAGNLVGAPAVRDFYGALKADGKAIKGIFITTTGFTPQAIDFARGLPVELVDGQQLEQLISDEGRNADASDPWSAGR